MKNEKKKKKQPQSTIVLDKLEFSCISLLEDNFNHAVEHNPNYYFKNEFTFGKTQLKRTQDPSNRYKHSFKVYYESKLMGTINFCLYYGTIYDMLSFSVHNEVFYNDTLKYIPNVLNDLNLSINNFKAIDIALDSYDFDSEQAIRRALKDKNTIVKLNGRIIYDRNKVTKEITYYNSGSLNNPYKLRTILIKGKNKKNRKELRCYDKKKEIKEISGKDYQLEFHKKQNPKCKNVFRSEIVLKYEEISRYNKKIKRPITIEDLMRQEFLYNMFTEYFSRIISVTKEIKRKKEYVKLVSAIEFVSSEGILQPTPTNTINSIDYGLFHNGNDLLILSKSFDIHINRKKRIINYLNYDLDENLTVCNEKLKYKSYNYQQ